MHKNYPSVAKKESPPLDVERNLCGRPLRRLRATKEAEDLGSSNCGVEDAKLIQLIVLLIQADRDNTLYFFVLVGGDS